MTICTAGFRPHFGRVRKGMMGLNACGRAAEGCWQEIPEHFPDIALYEFVVMPNHIHGIVIIKGDGGYHSDGSGRVFVGGKNFCPLQDSEWQKQWARSLSSAMRGFKIGVRKRCLENNHADFRWQKSFYDRVIRDEQELHRIRAYIRSNPARWEPEKGEPESLRML